MENRDVNVKDGAAVGAVRPRMGAGFWLMVGAVVVPAAARVGYAGQLAMKGDLVAEAGAMVHLRMMDGFVGWMVLALLVMADRLGRPAEKGANLVSEVLLAVGMAVYVASLLLVDVGQRAGLELAVGGLLAVIVLQHVGRTFGGLKGAKGVTVMDLWRLVGSQWLLVWASAEIFLRVRYRVSGVAAEEGARAMLFILPAVGVMPNVLMGLGAMLWGQLKGSGGGNEGGPRWRAWLVAMGLVNAGALLVVLGTTGRYGLGVVGAGLMGLGAVLYVAGFAGGRGRWVVAAWILFVGAMGMLAVDRVMHVSGQVVMEVFAAGWRHGLAVGVPAVWLMGMGGMVLRAKLAAGKRMERLVMASAGLVVLGCVVFVGLLVMAMTWRGAMGWLWVGVGLEFLGVGLGVVWGMRGKNLLRA